ncbi:MAG TPA: hotdog fold thioesterase [Chloroflexia bacterium]|nr:hotdog fold thioesterase [Chloroflexia bacterium]
MSMSNEELLQALNGTMKVGTIWEALDINLVKAEPDHVIATMPVGPATRQPAGFLHGGASVVLAESLASLGTALNTDTSKKMVFGIEINANHVRARREGVVTGEATILYKGRTNMVWDIKIRDEEGKLVCVSRCTVGIVDRAPSEEERVSLPNGSNEQ